MLLKLQKNSVRPIFHLNLLLVVPASNVEGSFAKLFSEKVKSNVARDNVNADGVYNGSCKLREPPALQVLPKKGGPLEH